ncbi:MAG: beta-propeller fold lactonase family protein [Phycisphaerales bacterium]|nr:MAG: beta-propeller fold lactonase family protein [Phycisphaerales bacterium]
MPRHVIIVLITVAGLATLTLGGGPGVEDRHPVYVGVAACSRCHAGTAAGHQFSLWRTSAHANAYACLWSPVAKRIAQLSGIPEEPQEAPMCLGCHVTAYDAEEWEKEQTFRLEDGVQCERCHGPGSEYMSMETMMDPQEAMLRGLKRPAASDCMVCHVVKGSHVAFLGSADFDPMWGMATIAHSIAEKGGTFMGAGDKPPVEHNPGNAGKFRYIGVMACAKCHEGPMMGYQFSKWRLGKHARAYAILGTPAGYKIAAAESVQGNPQQSIECLRCHTTGAGLSEGRFMEGFDYRDGVQCESCHGPGSEYSPEAVMRDPRAAMQAGLQPVSEKTCMPCHENAHGRSFDYEAAVEKIMHPTREPVETTDLEYKTPLNLALTPDGRELWVACEASDSVIVVDLASRRKVAEIETGGHATDVTFHPNGTRAYVSNRLDDTVSVIDTKARQVVNTILVGDEPHGVLLDKPGGQLYVLNTSQDCISVIDTDTETEQKRLAASRGPWSLSISPDGSHIAATNTLSAFVPFRTPSMSEVTVIDAECGIVRNRVVVPGANLLQGIDWHPSGEFALVTLNRTKNLVPMTRLLQGWTITNGIGVIWADGRVDQVLLDEPHRCFPDPADVAISPDGRLALVTSSGSDCVAVVDIPRLIAMLNEASDYERQQVFPNHLGRPTEFVIKRIPTRESPRGVTFAADGKTAYVANALDDSVTVIDVDKLEPVERIDLGGPNEITRVRFGERLFHSADVTFRRQFSCHSCHPDGHIDGITYDIEPDGIGVSPVDNRTLRGILDTAPFKWEGTNPSLQRQCGPRLAVFFTRIDPFTPEELSALDNYICTIPRPPNRYRGVGEALTPAQRRGKLVFERTMTNDGRIIPVDNRCITCHPPPLFTDRSRRDIGSQMRFDRESEFDVPHLNNIYDSAPYLHNGMAETLEQIWTTYNPYDTHGVTNDMTKDQLNDLIEYLKTL